VRELKESIMLMLGLVGQDVRLWDYFQSKPYALLDTPSKTLAEMQIIENQDLLVELPDDEVRQSWRLLEYSLFDESLSIWGPCVRLFLF
jgi:hypothetical protein